MPRTSTFRTRFVALAGATVLLLSACSMGAPMASAPITNDAGAMEAESAVSFTQSQVRPELAPRGMFFADYGVNGFVETAQNNLSTFALDVDTGSYTVARAYLDDGHLPPPASVRPEEFVNYFDYGYPVPDRTATFNIMVDGAPSPVSPNTATHLLRVGIQGYEIAPEQRPDVALTFVIDVSGSMTMENRLELVKQSLRLLVEELRPSDAVAVVVYGDAARIVLPMTQLGQSQSILRAIDSLGPDGATNAEAGLRMAYEHAWENFDPAKINRIVLASDGVANVGATGPAAILETIGQYAVRGLTLTTVGVGMGNYNDVLMEQLADQGDGTYAYVDGMDEARDLFVHDLTGTLLTIARDAKIQVEFNPETVARYRLVGYENRDVADDEFRNDDVDAGEIGAGHSVTALYEIELAGQPAADAVIATVRLRWEEPESSQVMELAQTLTQDQMATDFAAAQRSFQLAATVAEYAEYLRASEWSVASLAQISEQAERMDRQWAANDGAAADGAAAKVHEFAGLVRKAMEPSLSQHTN